MQHTVPQHQIQMVSMTSQPVAVVNPVQNAKIQSQQQGTMSVVNVTVPNGATPGMVLSVQTAHGMHQITIPQGAVAGQTLQVSVPAPQLVVYAVQAKPVQQRQKYKTFYFV